MSHDEKFSVVPCSRWASIQPSHQINATTSVSPGETKESPRTTTTGWNAIHHFMSLTFNFEIILYLYKSCQNSKESVHRLLTELPLILSLSVTMLHWAEPGNWHYQLETYHIPPIFFTCVFFMFQYPVPHSTLHLVYVFSVSSNL